MKPVRLISGFLTVGGWTLASRCLGFARDIVMASTLGAGPVAEAFLIAFALPNMFRRFFAEGALNMAFVPLFAKKLAAGEDAMLFARDAASALATLLLVLCLLAQVVMPWLVYAMASGFSGDERFTLAVAYGRIAFPYILFISLAAILSGILNTLGRFAAAAAAPVVLNVLFLGAVGLALRLGWPLGDTLAWTVPVAGVAQMALLWFAARQAGYTLWLRRPRITPDLRRLAWIAGPALLAGGVSQVNLLVGRQIASFYDGAVAWLSYADRLYQLPLGVVGIAIGVVLLPDLARRLRAGDEDGGQASLNRAGEFALALTIPAATALAVIALPLIQTLFQRGAFSAHDAQATALALAIYGLGLPAFVLHKVLQPLFYAREDTNRPFLYALICLGVNLGLAVGLMPVAGFLAAPIAMSGAAWVMVILLWCGSRRMGNAAQIDARLGHRLPRILAASAVMGAALAIAAALLAPALADQGWRYGALFALVGLGLGSYFGTGTLLGAFRLAEFRAVVSRKGPKTSA